jgi:ankyrin repeat-rich membrane spanning protein
MQLIKACNTNNKQFVIKCTDNTINERNECGNSPLMIVAKNGNYKLAKILLDKDNIDVYCTNIFGETALMTASMYGNVKVATVLLNRYIKDNVNINYQKLYTHDVNFRKNAMILAIEYNRLQIVKLFFRKANYDIEYVNNNTPGLKNITIFMVSAYYGRIEIINFLLEKFKDTIDIHKVCHNMDAMYCAIQMNHLNTVKLLLENYKNIHYINGFDDGNFELCNNTNLVITAIKFFRLEILQFLLEKYGHVIDINKKTKYFNEWQNTPLLIAIKAKTIDFDLIKILLKYGADVNIKDMNGKSSLEYATQLQNLDINKLFGIKRPIDVLFENNKYEEILKQSNITVFKMEQINDEICAVCLDNNVDVKTLCNHYYCISCFTDYYCVQKKSFKCGYCRAIIGNKIMLCYSGSTNGLNNGLMACLI